MTTVKAIVENYLSKTDITAKSRSKIIESMIEHGTIVTATLLEVKFTHELEDLMNNKLDLLKLYKEIK